MRLSDIPTKLQKIWASAAGGGTIHGIPTNSQIGVSDGAASLTDGFVPLNAVPRSSGGVPPDIKDFNGILNMLSAWTVWLQNGGAIRYDAGYVASNGGYPLGSILQSSVTIGLQFASTADNNMTDPDSGGAADWVTLGVHAASQDDVNNGAGAGFVSPTELHGTPRVLDIRGYVVRSDGLIEQWGQDVTGNGYGRSPNWATIAYPIPFPNTMLNISATSRDPNWSADDGNAISCQAIDNASFRMTCDDAPRTAWWRAIGF